ncbi:sensor histidine kinase [Shinella sp. S4-D37]|uniref:ATP-binding protein n=1 Tax=Shinella sp. S4-D37 TaxID=3161999 RepID=UPI003467899C
MLPVNLVVFVCLAYVSLLFLVAFAGDRKASRDPSGWLSSPLVYTLSISIYCTSWTFFGAVGSAARSGAEFVTIYLGPVVVFAGWWLFLRKLVTVGRVYNTTSIADLISARFGKSPTLGVLITVMALVGTTPYIALQLKALTSSFQVITFPAGAVVAASVELEPDFVTAFWVAVGLCVFSILFGVRNINVNERHHGVIAAIAVEALVKLCALVAVGVWVVFALADTPAAVFENAPVSLSNADSFGTRWVALCFLAGAAVICLPRQFQVTVVENTSEQQLRTASWLFPLYLFLICLFILPIAIAGLRFLPQGSDPDLFVLTLPLTAGQDAIALLAFLGGFSSATSMVIVSSIALSTMISNHIVMPIAVGLGLVQASAGGSTTRSFILRVRRTSICVIIMLGFIYFWLSGTSGALAAIGLISFCGVAQFLPSLVGGLYWRRATQAGAVTGLSAGFIVWCYTLFLPSFEGSFLMSAEAIENGLFGWFWLKPHALFGLTEFDPLVHALFWSLSINVVLFVGVSLLTEPTPLAQLQATLFIDVFRRQTESELSVIRRTARVSDLRQVAGRILGPEETIRLFQDEDSHERSSIASDELISLVEARLAANVGAASARSLVSQVVTSETIGVEELKRLAGEAEQIRAYSAELERKSRQVEATAAELAKANEQLREIDIRKDEFLSQVSHEVRTPMTSIRSFSEILLEHRDLDEPRKLHFLGIIQSESFRLTRLLDGILDLNMQDPGEQAWDEEAFDPEAAIDHAVETCEPLARAAGARIRRGRRTRNLRVMGSRDRLTQVFINLISNAIKHNPNPAPEVVVSASRRGANYEARVRDNGPGIDADHRESIFRKFFRGNAAVASGVGLGLPISRKIVNRFGGELRLSDRKAPGAEFIVRLPTCRAADDEI